MKELCHTNPSRAILRDMPDDLFVSFIDMPSVSDEGYIERKVNRKLGDLRKGSYTYFAEGDVIIAKITPCMENGKCGIATDLTNSVGMGRSEFHVFRPNNEILGRFLLGYLNRDSIRQEAARHMTGSSGHRRVPIEFYEDMEIPVPTIETQKKIVKQIEEYEHVIANAKEVMAACEIRKSEIIKKNIM